MKISLKLILPLLAAAVSLFSCDKMGGAIDDDISTSAFVYMVADNDLDYYGVANVIEMQEGILEGINGKLIVYLDRAKNGNPSHPCLYEIRHDTAESITSKIIRVYPETNSCSAECFQNALRDAEMYCENSGTRITHLVFWSHGTGWVSPKNRVSRSRSFGFDQSEDEAGDELDIITLSQVLGNRHYDYIVMDACFMGGVETAYQLRKNADFLILSPSEILSKGFPYKEITRFLVEKQNNAERLCTASYHYYAAKQNAFKSATITLVETRCLEKLAVAMSHFYKSISLSFSDDSLLNEIPQYDRTYSNVYFDFVGFVKNCCSDSTLKSEILSSYYLAVKRYFRTEKMFSSLDLTKTHGLSIYIPNDSNKKDAVYEYYKELDWFRSVADN
jgi:hypothetical protein